MRQEIDHEPEPNHTSARELELPHLAGRYRTRGVDVRYRSWCRWRCRCMEYFMNQGATDASRWLYESQATSQSAREVGVSSPCGVVSVRGMSVLDPKWLKLLTYGRIYAT